MTDSHFDEQLYRSGLRDGRIGRNVIILKSVDSTNRLARELGAAHRATRAPNGTVIIAEKQTAGRGRFRRAWASPAGGLWFSLVLRPEAGDPALPSLSLLAGVSLAAALEKAAGEELVLGWPNDIVYKGKKLAGILVENI
ncbi:MAG: biotin--[acetyl-CoA-carboxylase] ligase, partial [bacterium]